MNKKPVSKYLRPKQIKKDTKIPSKAREGKLKKIMNFLYPHLISGIIGILIGYFFFKLGVSKKDIEPINKGVVRIEQNVSQLRQDFLLNNDYKKYLEIYQLL